MGEILKMSENIVLVEPDNEFAEKVYVLADEFIGILKKISTENQQKQIDSKIIAEKMYSSGLVKDILLNHTDEQVKTNYDIQNLRKISKKVLDKITSLMPSSIAQEFINTNNNTDLQSIIEGSSDWLDSPINFVKKNISSMGWHIHELEEFIKLTSLALGETESQISSQLSLHQEIVQEDTDFNNGMSAEMNMIKQNVNDSDDLDQLKLTVLDKIDQINKGIEKKTSQDMSRLEKTEKTLKEMEQKMREIRQEADEFREKSNRMEKESLHDSLTGLYNRKAYDQKILETQEDLLRYKVTSSLIICDIDHFKKINDTFGHNVGDLALKKLASLFKERLRVRDFVARYGGEEFAIILPHSDLKKARITGQSIRTFIDNASFSYKNQNIPLTISLGISCFRKDDDCDSVFKRADKALYEAKKSGRNSVKTEEDTLGE